MLDFLELGLSLRPVRKRRSDTSFDIVRVEWLRQDAGRPRAQRLITNGRLHDSRNQDHRNRRKFPTDPVEQTESSYLRHLDVADHAVELRYAACDQAGRGGERLCVMAERTNEASHALN
jgi:hypothetical protein